MVKMEVMNILAKYRFYMYVYIHNGELEYSEIKYTYSANICLNLEIGTCYMNNFTHVTVYHQVYEAN